MTVALPEGRQRPYEGGSTGVPPLLYPARTREKTPPVNQDAEPPQTWTLQRLGLGLPAPGAVRSDCALRSGRAHGPGRRGWAVSICPSLERIRGQ